MSLVQRTSPPTAEFTTRLAVTLGALAIYRLGTYLPVAGIDQAALANLLAGIDQVALANLGSAFAVERVSILALGVTPIITALLVVEVVRLASGRFNTWANATPNARRLDHYVLIGSLLLAALQGYGIATGLEQAKNVVDEPGPQFQLVVVTTFVAGTALLVWLAALISRHGVGSGIWILLLTPYLAGLPGLALSVYEAVHSGVMSGAGLVAALTYLLIALVTVTALARTLARSGMPLDRTLIWPLYIASIPAGALAAVLNRGAPAYLAALAAIVIVTSLAQWQRLVSRLAVAKPSSPHVEGVGDASLIVVTVLTLAAITVLPEFLTTQFGLPMLIDGRLMTAIVAVALVLQDLPRWGRA